MPKIRNESHYQKEAGVWQTCFDDWLAHGSTIINNKIVNQVIVIGECASTQDVCMELAEESGGAGGTGGTGGCCVAVHQTGGRGRLGRKWLDERGECASFTLAMKYDGCAERLAVQCGIATCLAGERILAEMNGNDAVPVKIRWPNDVMVHGRKLAGVLIEVRDSIAFVGIGMNVSQRDWPDDLKGIAISLYEVNKSEPPTRPSVVKRILEALDETMILDDTQLAESFAKRDYLVGRRCLFSVRNNHVSGEVISLDPLRGLVVRSDETVPGLACEGDGCVFLQARTTSLIKIIE